MVTKPGKRYELREEVRRIRWNAWGVIGVGRRLRSEREGFIAHARKSNRMYDREGHHVAGFWNAVSAYHCSAKKVCARVPFQSFRMSFERYSIGRGAIALIRWKNETGKVPSLILVSFFSYLYDEKTVYIG